ncbi:MAG: ABC transporter permease [marine bacterium B5-7]|nr:MAG: ABC transporter permease [marine bacterium B5-7]
MQQLAYIGRRLIQLIPVLIGISIISFLLVKLSPGDPIRLLLGPRATDDAVAAVRITYGLDEPLLKQYFIYLGNLLAGDLGRSLRYRIPVSDLIVQFLPRTLFLIAYVMSLTLPLTIGLAIVAARHQGRWLDQVIRIFSILGMTIPVFWLAVLMARYFGAELGWFPVSGWGSGFMSHLHHLFLPALSTSLWLIPLLVRNLRGALIEQMESDYVVASRAKGLPESYIFRRHILRNSLLPTLHLLGVMIAFLVGGSVIVEIVYAVPGLGALMVGSVIGRDFYVVQGLTLVYAIGTVLVTLTVDMLTAVIDPRTSA